MSILRFVTTLFEQLFGCSAKHLNIIVFRNVVSSVFRGLAGSVVAFEMSPAVLLCLSLYSNMRARRGISISFLCMAKSHRWASVVAIETGRCMIDTSIHQKLLLAVLLLLLRRREKKNELRRCALAWARANLKASRLTRLRWSEICGEKIRVWVSVCYGAGTWEMSRRRLWHSNFCAFWLVSNLVQRGEHERVCMEKNTYFYIIACLFIFFFISKGLIIFEHTVLASHPHRQKLERCCAVLCISPIFSVVGRQRRVNIKAARLCQYHHTSDSTLSDTS